LPADTIKKPNILFIFVDDMGYGDLGFTGSTQIRTPNLDRLASEGIVFPQAYVTAPVCGPSRAGLLTGRYQQRFGFETNPHGGPHIRPEMVGLHLREKTLGDRMQSCGYHTACIGKWHMGYEDHFYPTQRGFDYFFGMRGGGHRYFPELGRSENTRMWYVDFALERMGTMLEEVEEPYLTDWLTSDAIHYIDRRETSDDQPWFMYLSYNCPHGPLQAKKEDIARYPDVEPAGRRTYCAMTDCLDQNVGRLLAHLEATGEADNTVIFFLNDNGGSTETVYALNAPFWGHKGTFWEGGIRVPMFIHGLDGLDPGTYDQPVSALDFMPTMMAIGGKTFVPETVTQRGQEVPVIYDGVDLLPFLRGEMGDERPHPQLYWRMMSRGSAMREGDWKLIFTPFSAPQLFNLANDPAERNDLAAEHPDIVSRMMTAHSEWVQTHEQAPMWLASPAGARASRNLHHRTYQLTQPE